MSKPFHSSRLVDLPKDDLYLLDTNLVIAYKQNESHVWTTFVDDYIRNNGSFFLLPQVVEELGGLLPPGFVPLKLELEGDGKSQISIDFLVNAVIESLDIKGKNAEKMRLSLEILVIAGYYAAAASTEHISDEKLFDGKVYFASSNLRMLKRILGSKQKCREVERLIDLHGYEHLIDVRMIILETDTWSEYVSFNNIFPERVIHGLEWAKK